MARTIPLVCLAAAAFLSGCSPDTTALAADRDRSAEPDRLPLVRTEPVQVRSVRREIETTAYLESERHVKVLSKIAGRVHQVFVDEGSHVAQGELLAQLDDREAQAALRQLQIQLEDRRVRAKLAALELEATQRREVSARIERDRAKAEYDRLAAQDKESVARKAMEGAEFNLLAAEEALLVAGFNSRKAVLDEEATNSAIGEAEARAAESQLRVDEHRIVAPFEGVVAARVVKGGETISAATELFDVVDLDDLVCYLSRPQAELSLVRDAREVVFEPDAYPGQEFHAAIERVLPVVDRETGHFRIRMRVSQDDTELLRPGMFIRARILAEAQREALMVPKKAILVEGDLSVVFAVRDGRAVKVVLEAGLEEQLFVESRNRGASGLQAADLVITAGHEDLADQARVEVHQAPAQQGSR